MKVERVHVYSLGDYPYKYRVAVPRSNMAPLQDVVDWANEIELQCCVTPGAVYMRTEADVSLFVLRWSEYNG